MDRAVGEAIPEDAALSLPAAKADGAINTGGCDRWSTAVSVSDLRVLVVAQGAILREGLRGVVDSVSGLRAVAVVNDPEAAIEALRSLHPGIVLIDRRLPHHMAFFVTRVVRREAPLAAVVMISDKADEKLLGRAADAGAAAVVLENIGVEELGAVMRTVGGSDVDLLGPVVVRRAG